MTLPKADQGVLSGKVALITGGTRGIGAGIARAMAKAGAEVVITGRGQANGEAVVKQIEAAGGRGGYVEANLLEDKDVDDLIPTVIDRFGKLDILVNNAGIDVERLALDYEIEDFRRILRFNLEVPFRLCVTSARHFLKRGQGGIIINITSIQGLIGAAEECAYAPAKHGLNGLTKVLAVEWAKQGIRVNAIAPGFIKTDMTKYMWKDGPAIEARVQARYPIGRVGYPEDMGGPAVFLASDAADFIHGQVLTVDGGRLAH
jgi:2-deoxy-D-gluconate 3-dehydrogenase